MSVKQKIVIVVVFVLSAIAGSVVAAHAEDIYMPFLSGNNIAIEATYTVCGVPVNNVNVYIDVFDGADKFQILTDENGVARWSGNNNSTVVYIFDLNDNRYLFQAPPITIVSFEFCDGVLEIIPSPITS